MSTSLGRKLIDRWRKGFVPDKPDKGYLQSALGNLERILEVVVMAAEHPAPSVGSRVACSATTAITTTADVDITGATITIVPEVDMSVMVWANFEPNCSLFGSALHVFSGALVVNGTAQAGRVETTVRSADDIRTLSGSWIVPLKSGTNYTLKLQAKTSNAGTQFNVLQVNTWFTYLQVPNLFQVP